MKKTQTLLIALIACLSLAAAAYAGNMRGMKTGDGTWAGRGGAPGFRCGDMMGGACGVPMKQIMRLDLTDAQRAQVIAVMEKYREDQQSLMDQLMTARQECAQHRGPNAEFDEPAIRRSHQEVSAVKEELAVLRGKIMAELKPILTEAQLEALAAAPAGKMGKTKPFKGQRQMNCPMMNPPSVDTQ